MAISVLCCLRNAFCVLGCVMVATLIYTLSVDGSPFRKDILNPWVETTLVDFYINVAVLAVWIFYKESNCIGAMLWVILLVGFGSIATCAYIVLQCLKLSSQDSAQDPIYHILLSPRNKDAMGKKTKFASVLTARVFFGVLGCLMMGLLAYTLWTDGSPFRKELLTPWMTALLIDFYINVVALSVWVAYKESSWIGAALWVVLLICFGSIATCAYIVQHLFRLSLQDPLYLVLLNYGARQVRKTCSPEFKQKL